MGRIPDELRQTIAANIRAAREKKYPGRGGGKKCAEAFGVSPQQWSPWERGMRTPDEFRLRQLAEFFEVSVEYLRQNHSLFENKPGASSPASGESFLPGLSLDGAVCAESEIAWQLHKVYSGPANNGQRWHVMLNIVLSKDVRKEA